ncbi:DUF7680 family protein [Haloferax marisrubri]|uniref:DUF7680 domain-containing protein n=1 Tax=Haloferax marisrubri TaxID=1544719 RepID=A0A2P4NL06_9EURY|nr:hypothetical protein [Haloferax marisrubri]POG53810.1 hypothetical protein AUR65_018740 [Haloferax marisrubri]
MSVPTQRDQEAQAFAFGSSVYGGRPTFGLTRRVEDGDPVIRLYELLPREQAESRRRRLERVGRHVVITPIEETFQSLPDGGTYTWDDWDAIKIGQLRGARLNAVLSVVREALNDAEQPHDPITSTGEGEVFISEVSGVRLSLAFLGVKQMQRVDRIRALVRGVSRMSTEECYYWYAKCRSPSSPNGVQSLRVLLTNHIE